MNKLSGTMELLLVSVLLQLLCTIDPNIMDALAFTPISLTAPLTLLTHMVSHGNWMHLLGNFSFGLPFMLFLENKLGKSRFLSFYVLCGLGSALLNLSMVGPEQSMIGSSGAIMGCMAGACMAYGNTKLEHAVSLGLLMFLLTMNIVAAPMEALTGIAYWGHIGGALVGMLLSSRFYPSKPLSA